MLALLIFVAIIIIYFAWKDVQSKIPFPGPPGLPLLGHAFYLIKHENRILEWITEMHYKYGTNFRIYLPFQPNFVFTSNPKNVEHVLNKKFDNYIKGPKFQEVSRELLGEGIFAVDGELWKTQRKVASLLFTGRIFRDVMQPVFHHHLETFHEVIKKTIEEGKPVNTQDMFYRFTLDSIGEIAFGINIGSLDNSSTQGKKFGTAFDSAQEIVHDRFLSPVPKSIREWIHPSEYKFREYTKYLNTWAYSVIKARRNDSETHMKQDLLSFFLNQKKEDYSVEFTDEFLRDILLNFMVAGRDTTAQLLTWFFYVLSKPENAEKREKIYKEVDEVMGSEGKTRYPTLDDIKKMKYLEAALTETLRLYPSVPKEIKMAVNDDVLPDGTQVKSGEWVAFIPYSMGRLPELWDEPLTYLPERFMKKVTNSNNDQEFDEAENVGGGEDTRAKSQAYKFVSFLGGPRLCLGQNMAYFEAKVVASSVICNYTFELVKEHKVEFSNQLTLPTKFGIKMNFTKRK